MIAAVARQHYTVGIGPWLLLAIVVALFAYSTTGRTSRNNRRLPRTSATRGGLRRVVGSSSHPGPSDVVAAVRPTPGSSPRWHQPRRPEARSTP